VKDQAENEEKWKEKEEAFHNYNSFTYPSLIEAVLPTYPYNPSISVI
jgi:hypothetical protein